MIKVKFRRREFVCDTPREAAELEHLLRSPRTPASDQFGVLYIPGGSRPPFIADGYDFIAAVRPFQGREIDSTTFAKRLCVKGTQGLGPFLARMDRALQQLDPPRRLDRYVERCSVAGKPTRWRILKAKHRSSRGKFAI
jgi:hypothetical protein